MDSYLFSIASNIVAGKSTFTKALESHSGGRDVYILERVDYVKENGYLQKYYEAVSAYDRLKGRKLNSGDRARFLEVKEEAEYWGYKIQETYFLSRLLDLGVLTELLRALYAPFNRNHDRLLAMDIRSAEMTKYAANCMLATKISFMNEISGLCEQVGADVEMVRRGVGSDSRIGPAFLFPGVGYGGSCFPKDTQALTEIARDAGRPFEIVETVVAEA